MSRREQLEKALENQNKQGGADYNQWNLWLLTDIALSLATISDSLVELTTKDVIKADKESEDKE